jgi:uncharacterized lipoprotein NlpE involved in copper resistance
MAFNPSFPAIIPAMDDESAQRGATLLSKGTQLAAANRCTWTNEHCFISSDSTAVDVSLTTSRQIAARHWERVSLESTCQHVRSPVTPIIRSAADDRVR